MGAVPIEIGKKLTIGRSVGTGRQSELFVFLKIFFFPAIL